MPITAYSNEAAGEVDLEQWLALNQYPIKDDSMLAHMSVELRTKAALDVECSGCQARGAVLVAVGRQRGVGRSVSQGHFRFTTAGGTNPHDPLCDFYDEKLSRDTEYLVNFASDKSALTRVVRDLVCRGIRANLFSQNDIRRMRLWFLEIKTAHAVPLDVTQDLLKWCIDMDTTRWLDALAYRPENGQLPDFDWARAARSEWYRRNRSLFEDRQSFVHFRPETVQRALKLIELQGNATVLDPTPLRKKYEAVTQISDFAAVYVYRMAGKKRTYYARPSDMGLAGRALLALCALLLFMNDWEPGRASAVFSALTALPPATNGTEGNVMGLNPFHDYDAWEILHEARKVSARWNDARPVPEQLAELMAEMQAEHLDWLSRSTMQQVVRR